MNHLLFILFSIFIHTNLSAIDLIESVQAKNNRIDIKVNAEFKRKYLTSDFFVEYDKEVNVEQLDYSIQIMPFIMNVLSIVWISGKDYYIESMDEELSKSLDKVKEVFRRMYPHTKWEGRLIPRKLVKNSFNYKPLNLERERTALLFSGGLDSTASSLYHREKKQLLITIQGHWDLPLKDKKLWSTRKEQLQEWAVQGGHENAFIESSYYEMLNRKKLDNISPEISSWRIFTVEGIGWAGLAAPLMAIKGYKVLLHGSTITWEYNYPAAANPFIDDNIYFAGMRIKHDLFNMNRLQKCEFISQIRKKENIAMPNVRVCEEKIVGNCCACQKCIRTIIEFAVLGEDPRNFGFTKDIEKCIKNSKRFMASLSTGATTVWHFMHIQKRLKQNLLENKAINPDLAWILDVNLKKKVTSEIKNQKKFDWRDLVDLLPEVEVPNSIELGF